MELVGKKKTTVRIFFLSFFVIFIRFFLITPIDRLEFNSDTLKVGISIKVVVYIALLFAFVVVASALAAKMYFDSNNGLVVYPLIFMLADSIFNFSVCDCLTLIASIVSIILYLLLVNSRSRAIACVLMPVFSLVFTTLSLEFAFSLIALLILSCTILVIEGEKFLRKKIGVSVILCTIAFTAIGVVLNRCFTDFGGSVGFYNSITSFFDSYIEIYRNKNIWRILLPAIPSVVFGVGVLAGSSKAKQKNDHSYAIYNVTGVVLILGIVGAIFFQSDAFLSLGLVVPVSIMTSLHTDDMSIIGSLGRIDSFVKKNFALCFGIAIMVEMICNISMYRYVSATRILDYVLELI